MLKLRERAEQEALRRLAQARSLVITIEEQIGHLRGQLTQQDRLVREGMLIGSVDVQYMSLYRRHVMGLHRRIIEQSQKLKPAMLEFQQAKAKALEARKQRRVLSTLKDKLHARYKAEMNRLDQRQMDEISSNAYTRRLALEEA